MADAASNPKDQQPLDLTCKDSDKNYDMCPPRSGHSHLDAAHHEKRRKDQNRCAAQSYRKRQRDLGSELEAQYEALQTRNRSLAAECHRLEQSVEGMRQVLKNEPPAIY